MSYTSPGNGLMYHCNCVCYAVVIEGNDTKTRKALPTRALIHVLKPFVLEGAYCSRGDSYHILTV